jgi:hypothetical protein
MGVLMSGESEAEASGRVLFLDFDGVLNSRRYFETLTGRPDGVGLFDDHSQIDPVAVERLNRVIDATGARVVASTSWRIINAPSKLHSILAARGYRHGIYGCTPIHHEDRGRYREIRAWLDANEHRGPFAIVDDDHDAGISFALRFVKTTFDEGLTDAHADRLIAILTKEPDDAG